MHSTQTPACGVRGTCGMLLAFGQLPAGLSGPGGVLSLWPPREGLRGRGRSKGFPPGQAFGEQRLGGRAGQQTGAHGCGSYHTSELRSSVKFKTHLKINLLAESCYIRANAYLLRKMTAPELRAPNSYE